MTSRDFCFWLQGFFELAHSGPQPPEPYGRLGMTHEQTEIVKRHLALVFKHEIDPGMGPPEQQKKLNETHTLGVASQMGGISGGLDGLLIRC